MYSWNLYTFIHNNSNTRNKHMEINTCKILPFFKISLNHAWQIPLSLDYANSRLPLKEMGTSMVYDGLRFGRGWGGVGGGGGGHTATSGVASDDDVAIMINKVFNRTPLINVFPTWVKSILPSYFQNKENSYIDTNCLCPNWTKARSRDMTR